MTQNTSSAVMAQRKSGDDEPDFYITPPWATRALFRYVPFMCRQMSDMDCLEPACGNGRMANTLAEYFEYVAAFDKYDYGFGTPHTDFLKPWEWGKFDFVITNPPFRLGEKFINQALPIARVGVAMLVRTVFIESIHRYDRLFRYHPPTYMAQFCERVPMVKGRLSRTASTATGYAWLVWDHKSDKSGQTRVLWIPKCRKTLEREEDYE